MIAGVSERSDAYGGLDGYLQSLRGPPTRVPSGRPQFAGAKTEPTSQVPVPDIKSSAATPGAKTNSVIPYARGDVQHLQITHTHTHRTAPTHSPRTLWQSRR